MNSAYVLASRFAFASVLLGATASLIFAGGATPTVGEAAKDFELPALSGGTVKLSKLTSDGPVVLVVLRGYPGYQCPICSVQFAGFVAKAAEFKKANAQVVFVYPGPSDKLKERANEFLKGRDYPANFQIVLDPDYAFTKSYGIRWQAPAETAYPSTFVIDGKSRVLFANVSKGHGGRTKAEDALKAIAK